jgi:hypothetical protein
MYHSTQQQQGPRHLEWRPDVERLRSEIEEARRTGNLEHLAIAEAECWIDLIDAELSARRSVDDPDIDRLTRWRSEIEALLKTGGREPARSVAQARRS